MDIQAVTDFITSVGFPIAIACAMCYICYSSLKQMTQAISEMKSAIDLLSERIERLEK